MPASCSRCGEKQMERNDWKLGSIAAEAVAEIAMSRIQRFGRRFGSSWLGRSAYDRTLERTAEAVCRAGETLPDYFALSLLLYSIHQPTAVYDVRTPAASHPGKLLAHAE